MLKRLFDVCASAVGLVVLSPLLVLVAAWVKLDSPGPALYRQTRVGLNGQEFEILKFRTMTVSSATDAPQVTSAADPRITRAGQTLRRLKVDELPQLWCVLIGDMSLVGPRPEVPKYVAHYPPDIREIVLSVRPGITDPASIEFSDEGALLLSADDAERTYLDDILPKKIERYVAYVNDRNFFYDLRIVFRTIAKLL